MAGINDTDIRLDDDWQLTQASTGDAPACSGVDCFLQDIRLEAISPGSCSMMRNGAGACWSLSRQRTMR